MPSAAVHAQMVAAIALVVDCVRGADGRRRVAEIAVLTAAAERRAVGVPAVTFPADGRVVEDAAAGALAELLQAP
jgi:pilus assembly protein CpaF